MTVLSFAGKEPTRNSGFCSVILGPCFLHGMANSSEPDSSVEAEGGRDVDPFWPQFTPGVRFQFFSTRPPGPQIREGVRGILVVDEQRQPHVYMLTEPASHYYKVMTRNDRMPVFIGSRI